MTNNQLANQIEQVDPDDLDALRSLIAEQARQFRACNGPEAAAGLFRLGERLEIKLRIARAKLTAQKAECYQSGFLLRALAADLPARPGTGNSLDVKA